MASLVFNNTTVSGGPEGIQVGVQHFLGFNVDPILHPEQYAVMVRRLWSSVWWLSPIFAGDGPDIV